MNFLEFNAVTKDQAPALLERFKKQAEGRIFKLDRLFKIQGVDKRIFQAVGLSRPVYMVMMVGLEDEVMISLAKQYGVPRGFPILWIPNDSEGIPNVTPSTTPPFIRCFGFYPKFDNDRLHKNVELEGAPERIRFFKKFSGFLGHLLAFEIDGVSYWTIGSKNNMDTRSPYVADAKRIFQSYITPELIGEMVSKHLHICAEMLSKNDQHHACRVRTEAAIVLCIGRCLNTSTTNGETTNEKEGVEPADVKPKERKPRYVEYLPQDEIVKFAHKFGLAVDSAVTIEGTENCHFFLKSLREKRDFLNDSIVEEILKQTNCEIIPGTVTHASIVGNLLEGLVLHLYGFGTPKIRKYKTVAYTIREMLIAPSLKRFGLDDPDGYNDNGEEVDTITDLRQFIRRWCVSKQGADYWTDYAKKCLTLVVERPKELEQLEEKVGYHIQIADYVDLNQKDIKINESLFAGSSSVILCLGPVGAGKTTAAEQLASIVPNSVHIDGDHLGLGCDTVSELSEDRNEFTRFKVIEALMQGKIPILSTGGGVLLEGHLAEFVLRKLIVGTLGFNPEIILVMVGASETLCSASKTLDVKKIYLDRDRVVASLRFRLDKGLWKLKEGKDVEKFITTTANKSSGNFACAQRLLEHADRVIACPYLTPESKQLNWNDFLRELENAKPTFAGFSQVRLLCRIGPKIGHISYVYHRSAKVRWVYDDLQLLLNRFPSKSVPGTLFRIHSAPKKAYVFARPSISLHNDNSTHITIDCGKHRPVSTKTFIKAIDSGQPSVLELDGVSYDLTKAIVTQVHIEILDIMAF